LGTHRNTLPVATRWFTSIETGAPQGMGNLLRKRIPLAEMSRMHAGSSGPGLSPNTLTTADWFGLNRYSLRCSTFNPSVIKPQSLVTAVVYFGRIQRSQLLFRILENSEFELATASL
jgi:hypothetical protein